MYNVGNAERSRKTIMNNDATHTANDPDGMHNLKNKSLAGIGALLRRQIIVSAFFFLGSIVLARILAPQLFGIYAIIAFVVQFFSIFSDVGIGAALIQKKGTLNDKELSTLFWLQQILVCIVVIVIFLTAPLAVRLYTSLSSESVWYIRVMALSFLFTSMKTVPAILLERALDFNKIARVDIVESVAFQSIAVTLAYTGFGVWSFIIAALCQSVLGVLLIYSLSPWRPSRVFNMQTVRGLLGFGLPYQGNTILSFIKDAVTPLFIGTYAGAAAVGYVNWARNFAFTPLALSQAFGRVAFPSFSKMQHDLPALQDAIERSIRMITLVMFPITAIMVALGPEITIVIFTDKWLPGMNAFYLFCFTPLFMGITLPMFSAILSLGNARTMLFMTALLIAIEWGIGVPSVIFFGFTGIAITQPVSYFLFTFIYLHILSTYEIKPVIFRNIKSSLFAALTTGLVLFFTKTLYAMSSWCILVSAVIGFALFGLIIYFYERTLLRELNSYVSQISGIHYSNVLSLARLLKNKMIVASSLELRTVRDIIGASRPQGQNKREITQVCDQVFIERLRKNPQALKMTFWENHFEWKALADYPTISGRVLDFGCGSGHSDILLARQGVTIHGIDMSPIGIAIADFLKKKEPPAVQGRLSFAVADVTKDLPEHPFDSAWASHVFEHIADPGPLFAGLRKWLKPGAIMLISVPLGSAYDDPGHVNHFHSEVDMETYLSRHVTVRSVAISREHHVIRAECGFD